MTIEVFHRLYTFNMAMNEVAKDLECLKVTGEVKTDAIEKLRLMAEELRAGVNHLVTESVHDEAEVNWGRFEKMRLQMEELPDVPEENTQGKKVVELKPKGKRGKRA
jgi:hypothetical protein